MCWTSGIDVVCGLPSLCLAMVCGLPWLQSAPQMACNLGVNIMACSFLMACAGTNVLTKYFASFRSMKTRGPMPPEGSRTCPHSSTSSSTPATQCERGSSAISLVLSLLLMGQFTLGGECLLCEAIAQCAGQGLLGHISTCLCSHHVQSGTGSGRHLGATGRQVSSDADKQ